MWTLRGLDNHLLRTWVDTVSNSTHSWTWSEDEIFREGSPLAYFSANGIRHYGLDHLGSTVLLTDSNGHMVGNVTYDAFGTGGATGAGMLQYTGHERDAANIGPQAGTVRLPDYLHARDITTRCAGDFCQWTLALTSRALRQSLNVGIAMFM